MSLGTDFSKDKKLLSTDIGGIDISEIDNLQNLASLIVITAPPLNREASGLGSFQTPTESFSNSAGLTDIISDVSNIVTNVSNLFRTGSCELNLDADPVSKEMLQKNLDNYKKNLISGNLLRCSTLVEGIKGLPNHTVKSTKFIENADNISYELPVSGSVGGPSPLTLTLNETQHLDGYLTFFTIWYYMKEVLRGTVNPPDFYNENGILNYSFSIYLINFEPNGTQVKSTVKLTNCIIKSLSNSAVEFDKKEREQKTTDVEITFDGMIINDDRVFYELSEFGILPQHKYSFNPASGKLVQDSNTTAKKIDNVFGAKADEFLNSPAGNLLADIGRQSFPSVFNVYDRIRNIKTCSTNVGTNVNNLANKLGNLGGFF